RRRNRTCFSADATGTVGLARRRGGGMLRPPMVQLSVNVNKIATLRNSRGGAEPRLLDGVEAVLRAGCRGITVHPRADQRHITPDDVRDVAAVLQDHPDVEFNIEGDPREE